MIGDLGTYGVTPVEAGYSVTGLVYAKALIDFFFVTTKLGWAVVIVGLYRAIWDSKKNEDFSYLWKFMMMFFIFFSFFIRPMALTNVQSAMEENGWKESTTQGFLKANLIDSDHPQGLMGLNLLEKSMNYTIMGAIGAITAITKQKDMSFLKNPFIINKAAIYLHHFTADGIQDPALRAETDRFLKKYYMKAINALANKSQYFGQPHRKWWPGDNEVKEEYGHPPTVPTIEKGIEVQKKWKDLEGKIDTYIYKQHVGEAEEPAGLTSPLFVVIKLLKDINPNLRDNGLKIRLLSGEVTRSTKDLEGVARRPGLLSLIFGTVEKPIGQLVTWVGGFLAQFISWWLAEISVNLQPYLEGLACMLLYATFPITVLFCFGKESFDPFFKWLFNFLWVKSWIFFWGIIHFSSIYFYTAGAQDAMSTGTEGGWLTSLLDRPWFNIATSTAILMVPVIARIAVTGVLENFASVISAATLHGDRGAGAITKKVGL